ncbi:acyl-CoA thioester hydrolase [Virgibacillus halotolerans]|uniref:acyl-CoA thioesterase n=1 Tax=Virgibacillus halotolerans TaxID=1071053 RepID=UPI0019612CDC|nr:thioesterase family protein [Virgibacillus halotolerans]MBM7597776.1 acyl-CoA thioester hydrolase [Virgibacillus halotolerans]
MKQISYIKDIDTWRAGFSFSIPINIRFSETDMFGHVNNVSPFIYFEEARIEFLKTIGLFDDPNNDEGMPIVADLQCDYLQQMFFGEKINLYVRVDHVGNTSLDVHYMALNEKGEISLTGRGRMVYIHPGTGKPIQITDEIKQALLEK